MSLLASYLRRQYKLLLLLAGFFCIFAAVFSLYTLPVEAVAYAGLLCFLLGLALFAVGYACFRSRHRELQRLLRQVQEKVLPLPPARGAAGGGLSVSGPGAVPRPGKTRHGK